MEFKELVKEALKELLENGDIEITTDIHDGYDGKYIETIVQIDNEQVYRNTESLYLTFR